MNPEIFTPAILCFTLIPVGLGVGFLLLKIQNNSEAGEQKMRIQGGKEKA
jgi:hypothetical protein